MIVSIVFAARPQHGSDREVGWEYLASECDDVSNHTIITSISDEPFIRSLGFNVTTIAIEKFLGFLPRSLIFQVWLIFVQLHVLRNYKKEHCVVRLITFTQIVNFFILHRAGFHCQLGPLGTVGKIGKFSKTSVGLYIKTYLIHALLYSFFRYRKSQYLTVCVIHPQLKKYVKNVKHFIAPAVSKNAYVNVKRSENTKRHKVIFIGRNVKFKNVALIYNLFMTMSKKDSTHEYIMIVPGWSSNREISENFKILEKQPRHEILRLLRQAKLHVSLTTELAGFVFIEAANMGCPSICLENSGGDYLLNPSPEYEICSVSDFDAILSKIQICLRLDPKIEAQHQVKHLGTILAERENTIRKFRKVKGEEI